MAAKKYPKKPMKQIREARIAKMAEIDPPMGYLLTKMESASRIEEVDFHDFNNADTGKRVIVLSVKFYGEVDGE